MEQWSYLKKLSKMETPENIDEFEKKVWDLAATKDPTVLGNLIDLFDDKCLHPEVMYSLVHAIETYPDEIYVKCIISKSKDAIQNSPFWYRGLVAAILNSSVCKELFIKEVKGNEASFLESLFSFISEKLPNHKELITELRKELQEKSI
ncbi:hypothetical protein IM40_07365 [Candidatus Paracaedimonas acanthamoebae]|nr:hypothetical protein IM40_07365 [Candidatus Paracaedimonas acanthamoebae]